MRARFRWAALGVLAVPMVARAQVMTLDGARGTGRVVALTANGATHRLQLPASVAVDMDTLEVLDARQEGAVRYLLLRVNGPSKRKGFGQGLCGAGFETALVWLKLHGWTLSLVRSQLVETCWHNRILDDELAWDGDIGALTYQDLQLRKRFAVRYDRTRPQRGFTMAQVP